MNIFVTGGTGFIGSNFVRLALRRGHHVRVLRRPGSYPAIPFAKEPEWLERPMDKLEREDLTGTDALVHFASVGVSPQRATWSELMYWNVSTTVRLMEKADAAGIKRIVIAGSFAEYGRSADCYDKVPPDALLLPTYAYAASKAAAFAAAYALAVERVLELCYLRIFSAYGEGQFEGNFWPALKKAALDGRDFEMTPGEQVRDYIPVELVADIFLKAVHCSDLRAGQPLIRNVGTGKAVSMREFAEYWWSRWKARGRLLIGALPYRANEVMRFVPDTTWFEL